MDRYYLIRKFIAAMTMIVKVLMIFIPCLGYSQIDSLLRPSKMTSLSKFEKAYQSLNGTFSLYTPLVREILPNIQECMYEIEEMINDPDGGPGNRLLTYEINFLVNDTLIFWYQSFEKKNRKNSVGKWEPFLMSIKSFKDNKQYSNFEKAYITSYKTPLNTIDLLNKKIVYGTLCSSVGVEPEYRVKIMALLAKYNIAEIRKWLSSVNLEKQLYAIEALQLLKKQGRQITPEENEIIKIVKNKRGKINTCIGCVYSYLDISETALLKE